MKRYLLLALLIVLNTSFSQTFDDDLRAISEAEAKSASNRINQRTFNLNTGNYDIKYHKLEFTIDPSTTFLDGIVTTHFEAKEDMTEVTFDLTSNMIVSQVLQNGNSLTFIQNTNDEIVITLSQGVNTGEIGIVEITYSGNPVSSGFGSYAQSTHNGDPIIWTLSEPYGAKGWWPCKQDLNDKVDVIDVFITTPQFNPSTEEYIAVSNGLEQSQVVDGANKTTHYRHQHAIPAYLIAIAVTNYEVYSHTVPNNGNPFEVVNYIYPENLTSAQASTPITVDIMNLFTGLFEEYPFSDEKYGHAQFGWGGGMEHTTVSFMGSFGRNLIAHELAHQWFGDKITCGSWKDIWLNEGFATYLSGLVVEDFDGNNSFTAWKQQRINSITSQPDGAVYLSDQDTTSVGRIFSSRLSYSKGAMVLHMLRKKVGDANFYQGMQDYLADTNFAYAYAKTPDYKAKMEEASGESLTEFFSDWIYNEGYPTYTINWNQPDANQVRVEIFQTQSDVSVSYFEAPVPLRIKGINNEILDITLNNMTNGEVFFIPITFQATGIEFDPEFDLISRNNMVTLGIDENVLEANFFIYPNPAQSLIHIQKPYDLEIQSIQIFNMLGQKVLETVEQESINIKQLSAELYFIRFNTNKGILHKTLLKK